MNWLMSVVVVVQILTALTIVVLVLIQHGKGADMGASFGSGSSGSLFGATGSANFLSRMTAICAAVFFSCTLGLAYLSNLGSTAPANTGSVLDQPVGGSPTGAPPTGAAQIPGADAASSVPAVPAPAPAVGASGPAGIPSN